MYRLGVECRRGTRLAKNCEEAVQWFRKAAKLGHFPSMLALQIMLSDGEGVEKNEAEASTGEHNRGCPTRRSTTTILMECDAFACGNHPLCRMGTLPRPMLHSNSEQRSHGSFHRRTGFY